MLNMLIKLSKHLLATLLLLNSLGLPLVGITLSLLNSSYLLIHGLNLQVVLRASIDQVHSSLVLLLFGEESLNELWVQVFMVEEVVNILDVSLLHNFLDLPFWRHIVTFKYGMIRATS